MISLVYLSVSILHVCVDVVFFIILIYFSLCMIFSSFQFSDFLNSLVVIAILVLEVKQGQESRQEDWLKYLLLTTHFRD